MHTTILKKERVSEYPNACQKNYGLIVNRRFSQGLTRPHAHGARPIIAVSYNKLPFLVSRKQTFPLV